MVWEVGEGGIAFGTAPWWDRRPLAAGYVTPLGSPGSRSRPGVPGRSSLH